MQNDKHPKKKKVFSNERKIRKAGIFFRKSFNKLLIPPCIHIQA